MCRCGSFTSLHTYLIILTTSQDISPFDPLAEIRTSLGLAPNFSLGMPETEGQNPPEEYVLLQRIYFNDPIVSTAVDIKAEMVLGEGWCFRGENKRDIAKAYKEFDRLNMYEVLLNFLKQAEMYGDAYLEPRYEEMSTKVKEVWALETSYTRIKFDENGKVLGYIQVNRFQTNMVTNKKPTWNPDELLHYSENSFGSNVYSYAPNVSIGHQFSSRVFGNSYIAQLFKNLPPKFMHILSNASKEQAANYRQALQAGKSNVNQDMVLYTSGESTQVKVEKVENVFNMEGLGDILTYLREEVLTRMRVPPSLLGLAGSAERTEPQMFLFAKHIRVKQYRLATFINKFFMPLLGLEGTDIFFNPVMLENDEKIMGVARSMIDAGMKNEEDEPALRYLRQHGFDIPEGTKLNDPKEKDIEGFGSRKREGMKEGKEQKHNTNSAGDSEESKEKIAKAQIRSAETVKEEALKSGDFELYRKALNGKV